jgi:hypothetical protein
MKQFLFLIPASRKDDANAHAKAHLDTAKGENTFSFGVSPTGEAPPTFYIANGRIPDGKADKADEMKTLFATAKVFEWDDSKEPRFIADTLLACGLKKVQAQPSKSETENPKP